MSFTGAGLASDMVPDVLAGAAGTGDGGAILAEMAFTGVLPSVIPGQAQ